MRDRTKTTRYLDTTGTGTWSFVANRVAQHEVTGEVGINRTYGSGVMYAPGKVLVMGGGDPPTNTAEVIDLTQPSTAPGALSARWQLPGVSSMQRCCPTALCSLPVAPASPGSMILRARSMPQSSGIRRPNSGQRSPAARASLAFTTLVHCCCPMGES